MAHWIFHITMIIAQISTGLATENSSETAFKKSGFHTDVHHRCHAFTAIPNLEDDCIL